MSAAPPHVHGWPCEISGTGSSAGCAVRPVRSPPSDDIDSNATLAAPTTATMAGSSLAAIHPDVGLAARPGQRATAFTAPTDVVDSPCSINGDRGRGRLAAVGHRDGGG